MPQCSSQILNCDVPIRIDSYRFCEFNCGYCYERKRHEQFTKKKVFEQEKALSNFIHGKRGHNLNWCDWDIPLRWGTRSDPFQPTLENTTLTSYKLLKIFVETKYPVIITTKSPLLATSKYIELLRMANAVVHISLVSKKYKQLEKNAPSFEDRLKSLPILIENAKRVIIRIQPYMREVKKDILELLPIYRDMGVYGIIVEGLMLRKAIKGFIYVGKIFCYPYDVLEKDFTQIKETARNLGLRFYCGENRLRWLSDSLTCCGCENLGWVVNKANLNYGNIQYTEKMKEAKTGHIFADIIKNGKYYWKLKELSYKEALEFIMERGLC